jgi:hypothetical protein
MGESVGVSPWAYIFPALAFSAALLYYAYGAVDRLGLETHDAQARVTTKNYTPGSTTYHTNIVANRAWTQSNKYPDSYAVGLDVDGGIVAVGLVTKDLYESLSPGERVRVKYQRTRFSNQVLVTDVRR